MDQLLLLARYENEKQTIKKESVFLNGLILDTLARQSTFIEANGIIISTEFEDEFYCISDHHFVSIIIPKSIAPKLIKLASIPKIFINEIANNNQSGITEATTRPERQFPNNNTTTKITIKQPRIKFSATVNVVLPTNSLRSRNPLI